MLLHKHTVFHSNFYYLITSKHNGMSSIQIILVHYLFIHVKPFVVQKFSLYLCVSLVFSHFLINPGYSELYFIIHSFYMFKEFLTDTFLLYFVPQNFSIHANELFFYNYKTSVHTTPFVSWSMTSHRGIWTVEGSTNCKFMSVLLFAQMLALVKAIIRQLKTHTEK